VSEDLSARLRRVEQQIRAFRELHQSELQIILDELTDIARQVDEEKEADSPPASALDATTTDPAASSPKRRKWLAEQEGKTAPKSRRDLLFPQHRERPDGQ
jgi:hypothetical protein